MSKAGRLSFRAALRSAWPGWTMAVIGSLMWGAIMAVSAGVMLWWRQWSLPGQIESVVALFFAGGVAAFIPALLCFRIAANWRGYRPGQRFAAAFILLLVSTTGFTSLIFSQIFRLYFAQWHQPFGTMAWANETIFTSLAAIYHFLVMGMMLFVPLGLPALVAASLWAARKPS